MRKSIESDSIDFISSPKGIALNKYRILKTLSAHGYGQLITISSTLLIPTIAITKWGAEGFGYWVSLSALAQFFLMADLGATIALSNQLCLKSERTPVDAWRLIREVLHTHILKVLFAIGLIILISWGVWLHYGQSIQLAITFMLLALSACLQPFIGIYCAAWRFIGKNAIGIFISNTVRLIEFLTIAGCAMLGQAMITAATIAFVFRLISVAVAVFHTPKLIVKKGVTSLILSDATISTEIKSLKKAGHGFMFISLSQQLALHGPTIIISSILGPISAATFTACRTISRLPVQPLTVLLASLNPEFTELICRGQYLRLRKVVTKVIMSAITISILVSTTAILYMDVLEKFWLRNKLQLNLNVLTILCLSSAFYISGQVLNQTLTSANQTRVQSKLFLLVTIFTILTMSFVLIFTRQLVSAMLPSLLGDFLMTIFLIKKYSSFTAQKT